MFTKLGIQGEVDPLFVQQAIFSGNLWGLKWKDPGIFDDNETSIEVRDETVAFLDMWDSIEHAYKQLSTAEKARVKAEHFGEDPQFPGFDGNHESEYSGVASFLTGELERFSDIGKRAGNNSGRPMVPGYRRMFEVFAKIRPTLTAGPMQADQIIEVLKAR